MWEIRLNVFTSSCYSHRNGHVTLWMKVLHHESPRCSLWWLQVFFDVAELFWPHCLRVLWFYAWNSLIATHFLATFNHHKTCGSRNTTNVFYQVILQDRMTKGSCYFMEGSSTLYITTLQCLVAVVIVVVDVKHI